MQYRAVPGSTPCESSSTQAEAWNSLLRALDVETLWQACVALITTRLPCHSCTLMYEISGGYQPQRSLHYLGNSPGTANEPLLSLDVAAPYLAQHPSIDWYTYSQVRLYDRQARQRLLAQKPAPGWREFVHLAFWQGEQLLAIISIRMRHGHEQLGPEQQQFLSQLHPLVLAGLQRIHQLQQERSWICHHLLGSQLQPNVVIDTHLSLVSITPQARQLLHQWDGHHLDGQQLPATLKDALAAWLLAQPLPLAAAPLLLPSPVCGHIALHIQAEPITIAAQRQPLLMLQLKMHGTASDTLTAPASALWQQLSRGETRVARHVLSGLRNDEIARQLQRSVKTIESQISAIYRKLDVRNRAQLVALLGMAGQSDNHR